MPVILDEISDAADASRELDALTTITLAGEEARRIAERWASAAVLVALALVGVIAATGLVGLG
jgi:hypothetical protein